MLTTLILVILVAAAVINYFRPIWGLGLVALAWPFYVVRWSIFGLPTTLLEGLLLVALVVFLFKNHNWRKWRWPKYWWFLVLWLGWSLLCVFINPNWWAGLGLWRAYFLEPLIMVFLALNLIKNKQDWSLVWKMIGLSAFLVAVWALIQKFTGWVVPYEYWVLGEGRRVTSIFAQPNALGLFLGPLVAWFGGRAIILGWRKGFREAAGAVVGFLAIIAARSDGAWIGLLGGFLVAGLWFKKTRYWALIGIMAAILILAIPNSLGTQVLNKFTQKEWSTKVRVLLWEETGQMLRQNWFLGVGIGNYQVAMEPFHQVKWNETFPYPHNVFLSFWSELGLPGLILFLGLLLIWAKFWWQGRKNKDSEVWRWPVAWALAVFLIHGLVDTPYFKNDLAMLFWWLWLVPEFQGGWLASGKEAKK